MRFDQLDLEVRTVVNVFLMSFRPFKFVSDSFDIVSFLVANMVILLYIKDDN